jgi:DNA polymerase-3 subunit alpha
LVTQYDGRVIEDAGVIKMDFLGLKTLTIIKDALRMIKQNHGVHIDIDYIPLDDQQTYELYQRGDTNGTFQFESEGMQMYLRELKPDKFEDLIAMNALYRPGPIEYIPNFIKPVSTAGTYCVRPCPTWRNTWAKPMVLPCTRSR